MRKQDCEMMDLGQEMASDILGILCLLHRKQGFLFLPLAGDW